MEPAPDKSAYWNRHYDDWLASGLSQIEYCRINNIRWTTFYGWKRRFTRTKQPAAKASANASGVFVPATIIASRSVESTITIRIKEVEIIYSHSTDDRLLKKLLATLEELS